MTYCLGWKTGETIILAADTALTSNIHASKKMPISETSFGEEHIVSESGQIVEERGLKIFRIGNFILTYTGLSTLVYPLIEALKRELPAHAAREAFQKAIGLTLNPPFKIKIICAFYENDLPILLSFNAENDGSIKEHENLVQLGSVPDEVKQITSNYLLETLEADDSSKHRVAKLLSILQIYGRHGPLMQLGIGGAFAAAYLDNQRAHWQPDMIFMVQSEDHEKSQLVSVCFRQDSLVISSPGTGASKCLSNFASEELFSLAAREQALRAVKEGKLQHAQGKFDYLVILNADFPIIVILEMQRKLKHDLIWIQTLMDSEGTGLAFQLAPELKALYALPVLNSDGKPVPTFHFRVYEKPGIDNIIMKKVRQNKKVIYKQAKGGRMRIGYY